MEPLALLIIIAVAAMIALVTTVMMMRARRISAARDKFGSEYKYLVEEAGSRHKAAALLHTREKRVERLKLRAIDADQRDAFDRRWTQAQVGFVDSPLGAVSTAHELMDDVLTARGYPDAKFEQRAADLSVHYPELVGRYRTAHEFTLREEAEELSTEELRQAMLAYKALYAEIVGRAEIADDLDLEPHSGNDEVVEVRDVDGHALPADPEYAERSFEAQKATAHIGNARDDERPLRAEVIDDDEEVLAVVDGKKITTKLADDRHSG